MVTAVRIPKSRTLCNTPWKYPLGAHCREGCTRPRSGLDTAKETVSVYRDSNPHLPAVSPYGSHECIVALVSTSLTIQTGLPTVTRNDLAWGVKIPCTSPERSGKLSSIRSDSGKYKDVTPCSFVQMYRCVGCTYVLHRQPVYLKRRYTSNRLIGVKPRTSQSSHQAS